MPLISYASDSSAAKIYQQEPKRGSKATEAGGGVWVDIFF